MERRDGRASRRVASLMGFGLLLFFFLITKKGNKLEFVFALFLGFFAPLRTVVVWKFIRLADFRLEKLEIICR